MIFAKENVRTYKAYTRDLALPFALWPYFYWVAAVPIATDVLKASLPKVARAILRQAICADL